MNILIERFIEQAKIQTQNNAIITDEELRKSDIDLEIFAKIIVEECSKMVAKTNPSTIDGSDGDVLRAVAEQLRIKFGISDGNVSK